MYTFRLHSDHFIYYINIPAYKNTPVSYLSSIFLSHQYGGPEG